MSGTSPSIGPDPHERTRHFLPRRYRLKRRTLVRALFGRRDDSVFSTASGCIRALARTVPARTFEPRSPLQVAFSPGRRRTAVERNRIKRHMREAFRTNGHGLATLFASSDRSLTLMLLYRAQSDRPGPQIARDLPIVLDRLCDHFRSEMAPPDVGAAPSIIS